MRKNQMKKLLTAGLILATTVVSMPWMNLQAADNTKEELEISDIYGAPHGELEAYDKLPYVWEGVNVETHTAKEIREYFQRNRVWLEDKSEVKYDQKPVVTAPYSPGKLSDDTQKSALMTLNFMRYIAGLQDNVTLDDDYIKAVQAGTLVNRVNQSLTHTPEKPADMDQNLYELGYQGTSRANIAMGYRNLSSAIIVGWLYDGDSSNFSAMGHRRWILNPYMGKTGFGIVDNQTAMYVLDESNDDAKESGVIWPAQVMPVEVFGDSFPWTYSYGQPLNWQEHPVSVKLIRSRDKKEWNFSSEAEETQDFAINNQGYGTPGCIVFRPDDVGSYQPGDQFVVTIHYGEEVLAEYTVNFMAMTEEDDSNDPVIPEPSQNKLPFVDVKKADWYQPSVQYVYEKELMTGLDKTHFAPLNNLVRAQYAVILWRMNGSPKMDYQAKFPDVSAGEWYTDAILWASANGIVTGYSSTGYFGTSDKITREQMAVMMYRYAMSKNYDTSKKADFNQFMDAAYVSEFAVDAMKWAVGSGIITGKDQGTRLDPQGSATRAECATIIMRFVEKYQ